MPCIPPHSGFSFNRQHTLPTARALLLYYHHTCYVITSDSSSWQADKLMKHEACQCQTASG